MELKHGFKLVKTTKLKDIEGCLYEYEHQKSGGTLIYFDCEDQDCLFAIGFKTMPNDSTGVCHIIEHSLLCGSEKYPLKEPFVNLIKGSMATFLNAFTSSDWTMYPCASQTPKDFDNIMSVYLDAVFAPLSIKDPKPFLQEGWHLEMNSEDELPSYKGVVYNEMKGAMSTINRIISQATNEIMFKDNGYSFNSGGDPEVIPTLTWEDYKKYYYDHYTPENAMTFLYGKMDIDQKLEFIDREYFSKYERTNQKYIIKAQEPHICLDYEIEYEIGEAEKEEDNTYMSLCYALSKRENNEETIAWEILASALLENNDSPVKKALMDAKLGQNVMAYVGTDSNIQNTLEVYLQKTNYDQKENFRKVFLKAIKELVDNGIDKKLLIASINNHEFRQKEMNFGRMPKSIVFAMNFMACFNYEYDYAQSLEYSKAYEKLRQELNNGYFEKLLDKDILNSNHYVEVVAKPSKTLGQERKAKMDALMQQIKNNMSKEEINACVAQTKELLAYQSKVDTKKELDTLPKLSLKDIPTTINYLDSKKVSVKGMKGISHQLNTNKIAYLKMYFDELVIPEEDLGYCVLLTKVLGQLATKMYSAVELNSMIKTYLGNLSFEQHIDSSSQNEAIIKFKVNASALEENIEYLPQILNEVLLKTKFTSKDVKMILLQVINSLRNYLIGNGMEASINMVRATSSLEGAYLSKASYGPTVYNFLLDLANDFDGKKVSQKLKEISKKLFTKKNCFFSVSGDQEIIDKLTEQLKLIELSGKKNEPVLKTLNAEKNAQALVVPSGVSYNALGNNLNNLGYQTSGKLSVLSHIVNYDYLWSEVRVKGGAYGVSLRSYLNSDLCLGSYRDPNVKNTYEVYQNIATYLEQFKPSKEAFKTYVIGAAGTFDAPLPTPLFIDTWDRFYLINYSKKDRIKFLKEMIHTTVEDVRNYHELFVALAKENAKYTIGNSEKIKEYSFDKVENLR